MVVQWVALSPHSKEVLGTMAVPDAFSVEFEWIFSMFLAMAQRQAKSNGLEWLNCPQEQYEHKCKCARVYLC